ncbi:heavy metal sensor histidine kinase [Photobacterium sp. BZF1]|nr:heavy metal sensor histidine kinase [Photobacterium sp. BZF1]
MFNSMSSKLIVSFFTASILVLFALSATTLYHLKRHFYFQDKDAITHKYRTLNKLQLQNDFIAKYGTFFELGENKLWAVEDNKVIYQSTDTPLPFDFLNDSGQDSAEWEIDNNRFRAFRFHLEEEPGVEIILGININRQRIFLNSFSVVLLWITLGASMVSGFLGWLIVKKGMRPVKHLEEHMKQISTEKLDLRIEPALFPSELQQLVVVSNDMLSRLEKEFERLSEYSSDIAHELRTPISNMMTQTQVILAHPRTSEEYQESLISTSEELSRLTKTITDMLYLAKSEHNLLQTDNEDIDLYPLIEDLAEYYELAGDEKGVTINLTGSGTVHGDKEMLKRALGNLISNAVRHSDNNEAINIQISQINNTTKVAVINKGETIPAEYLPYIFERFYRVDKARMHRATAGAGLGLAIARSIAKIHNGDILVRSDNGITSFILSVPK